MMTRGPALGFVGVEQCGLSAAGDDGGQLPAQVHRVLQAEIQSRPANRGVHVRGIADQHHPACLVLRGDSRVDAIEAAQIRLRVR
jgi:hypothetical protein